MFYMASNRLNTSIILRKRSISSTSICGRMLIEMGKQQYAGGEQELTFGADSIKGSIDSLNFTVNGVPTYFEYDAENPDIAKLVLSTPLIPGGKITVSTPFKVKIPSGEISRLGHIGQW